jgi:hypothetical protein
MVFSIKEEPFFLDPEKTKAGVYASAFVFPISFGMDFIEDQLLLAHCRFSRALQLGF